MAFYSLLHLEEKEHSAVNVKTRDFDDQTLIYLKCAVNLAKSLALENMDYALITNRPEVLQPLLDEMGAKLRLLEIPFTTNVPSGTEFYSAHYKIDCYRYFATIDTPYAALIDADCICVNSFPGSFFRNVKIGQPMCYDITDQSIPTFGADRVRLDLEKIHGLESEGRWYGGEFICGPPTFYRHLVAAIDQIYDRYVCNLPGLHHTGDESVTTAALEMMKIQGIQIADAGTLGVVARYLNCRAQFVQRPYEHACTATLLHLPVDKRFLGRLGQSDHVSHDTFFKSYDRYRRDFLLRQFIKTGVAIRLALKGFRTDISNPIFHRLGLKKRYRKPNAPDADE